ncbi:MAG: type IX secretion system sortase PorU [Bacteroidales bacterium]|nr:type IX secretion system sortase PorU [Bacteroidales bacterium]
MKRYLPLLLTLLLGWNFALGQTIGQGSYQYEVQLEWIENQTFQREGQQVETLYFEGSQIGGDFGTLPVFMRQFKLEEGVDVQLNIANPVYETIGSKQMANVRDKNMIPDTLFYEFRHRTIRKNPYGLVRIMPLRKNAQGSFQQLTSFTIKLEVSEKHNVPQKITRTYADNSVLASGEWFKVRVEKTGVYKITYSDLDDMGMDMESLSPGELAVFGNGGGMLPEANEEFRHDDLEENAIKVVAQSSGSFSPGDYILFYAEGPDSWTYNPYLQKFDFHKNAYSDHNYYFITRDAGEGKRITPASSSNKNPTDTVTRFIEARAYENDLVNLAKTGRVWYGEKFDPAQTNLELPLMTFPNIDQSKEAIVYVDVAGKATDPSTFSVVLNGQEIQQVFVPGLSTTATTVFARYGRDNIMFDPPDDDLQFDLTFNPPVQTAKGWLNKLTVNVTRFLSYEGSQMAFNNVYGYGYHNVSRFELENYSSGMQVWEVTNPTDVKLVEGEQNGGAFTFKHESEDIRYYHAFDGSEYLSPEFVEVVENQNLHALEIPDYLIISHKDFMNQAYRLAALHRENSGMKTQVVEVSKIYNEFSSGRQDITALRDFVKMFYDRGEEGNMLKYLLLFGDASFDYKDRLDENSNYVPTFEARESLKLTSSYVSDDYFGLLDEEEGETCNGALDIGIGRFPVETPEKARETVDKIEHYMLKSSKTMGAWRNEICFIADDEDNNLHMRQAEKLTTLVDTSYPTYNLNKVYLDSYNQISTPNGHRYPEVNETINKQMKKGAIIINYTGHGGETGWAAERVLTISDINTWDNFDHLPVFVTATCEFSRFDDPTRVSAGELVFLKPDGGAIALFTTTRLAFASHNLELNRSFYDTAFIHNGTEYPRLGDLIAHAKNDNNNNITIRNFALLGDPALQMAYPKNEVVTTQVNGEAVTSEPDSIAALSKVTVNGFISNKSGVKASDYEGVIYVKVFDKASEVVTKANDPGANEYNFEVQNNLLYSGKASVEQGEFEFSFIVPKDIDYSYGFGKISYYAKGGNVDAHGYFDNLVIGGSATNYEPDNTGPQMDIYLNDESFVSGGTTDTDPLLLAYLSDESGINTVGNGIGHDIVATLDGQTGHVIVLNEYFEGDLDTYKSGKILYPMSEMEEGEHTLTLKAWDVFNNSSEKTITFEVSKSFPISMDSVYNAPNPFRNETKFHFRHNRFNEQMNVIVKVYNMNGQHIKTVGPARLSSDGYSSEPLEWDGTAENGKRVRRGIYVYQIIVSQEGRNTSVSNGKMILLSQ